ncbi:Ldh family oxidoreductase [Ancylobacter mangrovi]|uniref:Ldh family oxidoreductase n=1 Tax=Ancylobacter mangrovi TaxID=2972472 RepID=UPI0021621090|nr:Ldh family oxidoreductase [Ancylobacter mangrovi]MCS0505017.1 Ldh family oxidoreductase [Ancylobacter mangrovi]
MLVKAETAREVCIAALARHGVSAANAGIQAELLVQAELMGHPSHGLQRLPRIIERIGNGVIDPVATGAHDWQTPSLLDVDGQMGLGPVVLVQALEEAARRTPETGVVLGAIHNSNHIGMLSWYVRHFAERGFVSIIVTTSEALVHPLGGRRAMIGTNPLAIGVPATPDPFVLDMASGLVSMGKIHDYAARGEPIPDNWALDAEGNPTTDAAAAKGGAIAPFGGGKGYGLGLGIELLVGALTGCALGTDVKGTLDSDKVCNKGDLFILIDPAHVRGTGISAYLDEIRHIAPIDPAAPVLVPGDRAVRVRAERTAKGIPVNPDVWRQIENYTTQKGKLS